MLRVYFERGPRWQKVEQLNDIVGVDRIEGWLEIVAIDVVVSGDGVPETTAAENDHAQASCTAPAAGVHVPERGVLPPVVFDHGAHADEWDRAEELHPSAEMVVLIPKGHGMEF
jgi:hypothetical protein